MSWLGQPACRTVVDAGAIVTDSTTLDASGLGALVSPIPSAHSVLDGVAVNYQVLVVDPQGGVGVTNALSGELY